LSLCRVSLASVAEVLLLLDIVWQTMLITLRENGGNTAAAK